MTILNTFERNKVIELFEQIDRDKPKNLVYMYKAICDYKNIDSPLMLIYENGWHRLYLEPLITDRPIFDCFKDRPIIYKLAPEEIFIPMIYGSKFDILTLNQTK